MAIDAQVEYPTYLQSLSDFEAYLADHFQALNTTVRGHRFAEAALLILPYFPGPDKFFGYYLNPKKSHDGGIDIFSEKLTNGTYAACQSKLKISTTEELDSILSKFYVYERDLSAPEEGVLFSEDKPPSVTYVIATGSNLEGIRRRYDERKPSSYSFYKQLCESGRLHFVDGKNMLSWMRRTYIRSMTLPASFKLESSEVWLNVGDVHIGVLAGQSLIDLVKEHGDGLFFENIRDWLGGGGDQLSVNNSIADTIKNEPSRMLERNNGITVRAESVERLDGGHTLMIHRGAIVNGCQTTMCLWELQNVSSALQVVVKVVTVADTEAAWRIAQSANYQNPVTRMELELARFLRPQLVARAAAKLGEGLKTDRKEGLAAVLRSYTQTEVSYVLIRHLFVGLFSRRPNQLFQDNYTNFQMDVASNYYTLPGAEDHLFTTLFTAIKQGREALVVSAKSFENEDFAKPFSRLLDADQHKYQAYLLLLALCTSQRVDLSERADVDSRSRLIFDFLSRCSAALEDKPQEFSRAYLFSYKELARITARPEEDSDKIIQRLSSRVRDAPFHDLYSNICMELKSYETMREFDHE
jgi:hypothetical protein